MPTYTTRDEAIHYEIELPLGEFAGKYDIDAIADWVITPEIDPTKPLVYKLVDEYEDSDKFWDVVENNAL